MSNWVSPILKGIQSILIEHYSLTAVISNAVFSSETNSELVGVLESQVIVPDDASLQQGMPFLDTKEMFRRLGPAFLQIKEEVVAEVLEAQVILKRMHSADASDDVLPMILLLTQKFKIQETAFKNYVNALPPHELLFKVPRIELFGNRKDDSFGMLYEKFVSIPRKVKLEHKYSTKL